MRIIILSLCMMVFSQTVQADTIVMDQSLCKYLVEHKADADVEYQPGIDVHGKPVVGADLDEPVINPPEVISFPITVDAAEYSGLDVPAGVETEINIGQITLENKQLKFNGEPLTPKSQQALIALCHEDGKDDDTTSTETTE